MLRFPAATGALNVSCAQAKGSPPSSWQTLGREPICVRGGDDGFACGLAADGFASIPLRIDKPQRPTFGPAREHPQQEKPLCRNGSWPPCFETNSEGIRGNLSIRQGILPV